MKDGFDLFLTAIAVIGPVGAVILLLLFFPEKLEKWSSILWKLLSPIVNGAHKKYVKHDLQGRVNGFIKQLNKEVPDLEGEKLNVEWVEGSTERESFLSEGKVVIRLRKDDPQDHNFVHGVVHWIRRAFLRQAKQYLAKSQTEAVDLFTCTKLIESEKPKALDYFLETYLHPGTANSKVKDLVVRFEDLNNCGLFFPVFVQELKFLGQKVFGKVKSDQIVKDVAGTLDTLESFSNREVGDEADNNYSGTFCRFEIVIVGKAFKVHRESTAPYIKYLQQKLTEGVETLYVLAPITNEKFIQNICVHLGDSAEVHRSCQISQKVRKGSEVRKIEACLFVIRRRGVNVIAA